MTHRERWWRRSKKTVETLIEIIPLRQQDLISIQFSSIKFTKIDYNYNVLDTNKASKR